MDSPNKSKIEKEICRSKSMAIFKILKVELKPLHTDARRKITNICALPLLLFFGWISRTGWLDEFSSLII